MDKVTVQKVNEVYCKVIADPGIIMEMSDFFTFEVPGAKFTPAYKAKFWDGKIRLLHGLTCQIYLGLVRYIEDFCKQRGYEFEWPLELTPEEYSLHEANQFIESLQLPLQPRDYQIEAFTHAVRENRALLLSPTASGKSLIIYLLMRYYNAKTLIVVPTTSLVSQLASDFGQYGFNSSANVHRIFSGQDKHTDKPVTISTWQSIYKMDKSYFDQFDVVIGDEAHLFKAKSLQSIMEKLSNCKYRFGFTGTLDGAETNKLVLEGVFGPVRKVTTTAKLIEDKHLAEFMIKSIILEYPDGMRQLVSKMDYHKEIDYIVTLKQRNKFIVNLVLSLEGNTLLLYQFVDKHGKVLYDMLSNEVKDRNVYFVSGSVDGEIREDIRAAIENDKNGIIVASSGTFSTGINIKNLHNIIFSSPSKSRVRNLQSIGRGLRKSESKTSSVLYDISDDFTWKNRKNFTILHYIERMKIYISEKFKYKIYRVKIKE